MKYKKIIMFIILILVTIPICLYISGIIHFSLTNQFTTISELSFNKVFQSVIEDKQHLKVFGMLQSLITLFLFLAVFITKENIYASGVMYVTNKIKTPIAVGQGQYGSSRWLKKGEFIKVFNKNVLDVKKDKKSFKFNSGGLVVGYNKLKRFIEEIFYISSNTHSLVVGATRSGKSRTIVIQTILNLGFAGESIIVSDPKGELYDYTAGFMKELDYETLVIDFKNPLKSNSYNFLKPIIDSVNEEDYAKAEEYSWDLATALVGDNDIRGEKIWKNGEMSIIAGAIMSVVYDNKDNPEYQNLTNVYMFISEMCITEDEEMPLNDYIRDLDSTHPASRIFSVARIAPERTRGSFFTSALATLRLFSSENVYSMTCSSEFDLRDTGNKKRIIYIILPDNKLTYYSLASLLVNQQYTALVESADSRGGELVNRVNFVLDEFGNFTTINGFSNMLTVGGGRKIRFNIFLQSFAQLEQKYGKENAENILDNCQTWIYLKTSSTETATKIMKKLGNYTTSSYSKSTSFSKYNMSSNDSQSMNLISRPLLTEEEILRIERPYVLVINTGDYPAIVKIPDLSKWSFNKMLGLGSESHNRKVREERGNLRKEKQTKEMQLWQIWKEYK